MELLRAALEHIDGYNSLQTAAAIQQAIAIVRKTRPRALSVQAAMSLPSADETLRYYGFDDLVAAGLSQGTVTTTRGGASAHDFARTQRPTSA